MKTDSKIVGKKILLLSCFPPAKQSAFQRINGFATHLSALGHDVTVMTLESTERFMFPKHDNLRIISVCDKGLIRPFTMTKKAPYLIHKTKAVFNIFLTKTGYKPYQKWIKNGLEKARNILINDNIDVIISSFAPTATHEIALRLKKEFPAIKWIADMRDEMSCSPYVTGTDKIKIRALEKEILERADIVTTVSKPILGDFIALKENDTTIFAEIRNGYNVEATLTHSAKKPANGQKCRLAFLGSFYGDIHPHTLFDALNIMGEHKEKFEIRFIGVNSGIRIPDTLNHIVKKQESVDYAQATQIMKNQDGLLLILPNNGRKGVYSGKVFEYLASGTPILGIIDPTDVAADLIIESNTGYVANFDAPQEIVKMLETHLSNWEKGIALETNQEVIKAHHRREQVRRLDQLMKDHC